ncbi:MAG: DNA methylase, partial [Planctomycetes bacterium DG_20]
MAGVGEKNLLCYGDNLDFLSDDLRFPNECVDLIYLDPPFNSQQSYNVLFKEATGTPAAAQIKAFEDTWTWDLAANKALTRIHQDPAVPAPLVELMRTFMNFLKATPMMAYLVQMAIRLVHMQRVLKPTGSLYLHCDPTASHYLKLVLDAVFGPVNFRSEITWKRTHSHGNVGRNYGAICDTLLFYSNGARFTWGQQFLPFSQEYTDRVFKYQDPDGRKWQSVTLRNPGKRPNLYFPYEATNGVTYYPHPNGWSCDLERLRKYDREGRLHFPRSPKGALRLKMYLDESPGVRLQNLWDDIPAIGSRAAERMGYPTQKPLELLKRIVAASSNPGDVVMDPFCGCGTTIDAVETLNREQP